MLAGGVDNLVGLGIRVNTLLGLEDRVRAFPPTHFRGLGVQISWSRG